MARVGSAESGCSHGPVIAQRASGVQAHGMIGFPPKAKRVEVYILALGPQPVQPYAFSPVNGWALSSIIPRCFHLTQRCLFQFRCTLPVAFNLPTLYT